MKTIDDILTEDINENSEQVFNGGDIVIFFNKSNLINNFTNNWFWKDAKNLKKKRDVEAKMKRKNIEFYYYSTQRDYLIFAWEQLIWVKYVIHVVRQILIVLVILVTLN